MFLAANFTCLWCECDIWVAWCSVIITYVTWCRYSCNIQDWCERGQWIQGRLSPGVTLSTQPSLTSKPSHVKLGHGKFDMVGVHLFYNNHALTRLNPFARLWFYNATAVRGALWWLRESHSVNYANHQHSPFARPRHDFRQAAARRCKLHFPRHRLVKVSWKSVQTFPRTVVSYFLRTEKSKKKQKKNICKTYTHPPHRRLRKILPPSSFGLMASQNEKKTSWTAEKWFSLKCYPTHEILQIASNAPWFCSFRLWRFINHLLTYLLKSTTRWA